jgi:Flp pilus assembly protein TadG
MFRIIKNKQNHAQTIRQRKPRSMRGTSMIEAVTAAFVLVPIALCLVDLGMVVVANSMNDTAAKNAARAAANQTDGGSATLAAKGSLQAINSPIVKSIDVETLDYVLNDSVTVQTKMIVHLPVPFPGLSDITFMAQDVEPIVAFTPPA